MLNQMELLALLNLKIWKIKSYNLYVLFLCHFFSLFYKDKALLLHVCKGVCITYLFLNMDFFPLLLFFFNIQLWYLHKFIIRLKVNFYNLNHLSKILVLIQLHHNLYKIYMYANLYQFKILILFHFQIENLIKLSIIFYYFFVILFITSILFYY